MLRMMFGLALAFAAVVVAITSAKANDGKTIRIQPRAFLGATVSLESGVRVFRPLPATTTLIINPNKTPVNLTIDDRTQHFNASDRASSENRSSFDNRRARRVGLYNPRRRRFGRFKKRRLGHHRRKGGKRRRGDVLGGKR